MISNQILKSGTLLLLLLFFCMGKAQQVTVANNSQVPIHIEYAYKKVDIGVNQKKTISGKDELKRIDVRYDKDKKVKRYIYLFLNPQESLSMEVDDAAIKFTGDKSELHDYVNHRLASDLTLKMSEYQSFYQKNDAKGFIRTSEMYLGDALQKAERLNHSPSGREDIHYKEIERMAKDQWFFTVFMSFGSSNVDHTEKELLLYYFEKYFKKDIAKFSCNSWTDYSILRRYSLHRKLLNLQLPKYEIVAHTDEDDISQYLPAKCQEFYFRGSYDFWIHKKDTVRAEKERKILTEKFHARL